MSVDDDEYRRSSSLLIDNDRELDSGTGYESASEGSHPQRRKMSSGSEDEAKKDKKRRKKDKEKQNGDKDRAKSKKEKTDVSDKYRERDGFIEDDWKKNNTYKTFFIEPTEDSKHIHVMEIARTLHNIKITNYTELSTAGRNRYKITFANPKHAENLINSKILTETFKYKIYVPNMFKETIGVVRDIPPSISDSEIFAKLESNRIKISKVERIMKMDKGKLVPTYSVRIFAEGDKLPKEVTIFGMPRTVDVYLFPLKYCLKCLRYGHRVKACKSKQDRCYVCGNLEHEGKSCTSMNIRCFHCAGQHKAFDINCRERIRQENINKSMAYNKLTFNEAEKRYPRQSQTEIRLQSNEDFPTIDNNPDHVIPTVNNWTQKTSKPNNNTGKVQKMQENPTEQYITKTELEQIVNTLKAELVKQLNMNKMISKMKQIKEQIDKAIQNTDKSQVTSNSNSILKNLSDQIQELVNPTFLKSNVTPQIVHSNIT